MSKKSPSQIVSRTRLWPASFTKPEVSQKVCVKTYIFKNGTDIQKFIQFVEESFPKYRIDIKQNEDGSTSVSVTSTTTSASNDLVCRPVDYKVTGSNYPDGSCSLNCAEQRYIYYKEYYASCEGFKIWKTCATNRDSTCTFYVKPS